MHDALPARFRVLVDLGAGLGRRQGECFGLAVDDVDFLRGVVRVRRQVKTVRYTRVFALPKYDKERNVSGGTPTTARLIVTSMCGLAVAANDFNRNYWKAALESAGVPSARYENGMHELRHFFASALLDQGESIKAVAEWLGHTDPAFTLATYTHLMPSSDERTKSAIANVYSRRPGAALDGPATAQNGDDLPSVSAVPRGGGRSA